MTAAVMPVRAVTFLGLLAAALACTGLLLYAQEADCAACHQLDPEEWHFYWVIFDPVVYPMDTAWWTGRSPLSRAHERRPSPPPRPQPAADDPPSQSG